VELVIGTANLAQEYGLQENTLKIDGFKQILKDGMNLSRFGVDTSPDYGNAETFCNELVPPFAKIYSKIRYKERTKRFFNSKLSSFQSKVVMVHNWEQLSDSGKIRSLEYLEKMKQAGKIAGYGFSTYFDFGDAKSLLAFPDIYIQAPLNVLNQSNLKIVEEIKRENPTIKILARSIFLQGVMTQEDRITDIHRHPDVVRFKNKCRELNIRPVDMALEFILTQNLIDGIVVGVDSFDEWKQIKNHVYGPRTPRIDGVIWKSLESYDKDLIDPRGWL